MPRYPTDQDGAALRNFAAVLAEHFRAGGQWPWEEARNLVQDATRLLERERSLERVSIPPGGHVNVVGDVHGQFFDMGIWEANGLPSEANPYIFNGDFVDRGSYSVETLLTLLAWKVALPAHFRLARGNHESHEMNVPYGFAGEVFTKYAQGDEAYDAFQRLFAKLPLAHVVNTDVLVVHGGLPRDQHVSIADIEGLDRARSANNSVFTDLLWADPCPELGSRQSQRGESLVMFGPDVTKQFLEKNGLGLLIRSHEVKDEGFEWAHDGFCLTVFSAPDYCDSCDNKGAVVRLQVPESGGPPTTELRKFTSRPRPSFYVPAMVYSPLVPACRRFLTMAAKQKLARFMG